MPSRTRLTDAPLLTALPSSASIVNQAVKDREDNTGWRTVINIQFVWAGVLAVGMFCLPESPRFLMLKGRPDRAKKSISVLTRRHVNDVAIEQEMLEIQTALDAELALGKASYLDCFRNNASRNGFRTMTGILIQAWQQLTGINFIFYYGTTFFERSGFSNPVRGLSPLP
jgi:SP family sugar:H+ symporter-like MFS transporter